MAAHHYHRPEPRPLTDSDRNILRELQYEGRAQCAWCEEWWDEDLVFFLSDDEGRCPDCLGPDPHDTPDTWTEWELSR